MGALYFVCLIPAHVDRAGPSAQSTKSVPLPFRDPTLPASTRAWDIIGRLTVAEKAALLSNTAYTVERLGGTQFDSAVQSLQGNECLHGVGNVFSNASGRYFPDRRVTSFPQAPPPTPQPISPPAPLPTSPPAPPPTHYYPHTTTHTLLPTHYYPQAIGLAASWNTSLLWGVGDVTSTESVALRNWHRRHNDTGGLYNAYLTCWAPVVNIARDARWGRVPETYGEDPHLTQALAAPFVRALQGAHPHYLKVVALLTSRHTGSASPPKAEALHGLHPCVLEAATQVSELQPHARPTHSRWLLG